LSAIFHCRISLYIFRSSALARLGQYDEARQDAATAERLAANEKWVEPLHLYGITALLTGDLKAALGYYDQIARQRPHDWLVFYLRGVVHYYGGDYQHARDDLRQSVELGPEANFPYLILALLDLHEGKLDDARKQVAIAASKFPDANAANRLLSAYFGDTKYSLVVMFSAFGNLLLGRYIDVVRGTEDSLNIENPPADLYLARGLALCIGKQYPEAEAAYSRGLDLDPNFALLHLLRAEVRQKQENQPGALEDLGVVEQSSLAPYLDAAQAGKLGCATLLATQ
jgi:tetratricopeptide (TPR) repeat protein